MQAGRRVVGTSDRKMVEEVGRTVLEKIDRMIVELFERKVVEQRELELFGWPVEEELRQPLQQAESMEQGVGVEEEQRWLDKILPSKLQVQAWLVQVMVVAEPF